MDDLRCPRCGEDRQIERVTTGNTWVYFCAVCATSFPGERFVHAYAVSASPQEEK